MAGGNRRLPRNVRSTVPTSVPLIPGDMNSTRYSALGATVPTLPGLQTPQAPKHIPFPNTPILSDAMFEITMFLFSAICSGLQFLHLYRSIWWLPHSYTRHAVNFYLIDLNLVIFIIIILSRRAVYMMGCRILDQFIPMKVQNTTYMCYRLFLFGFILSILFWCTYYIIQNHPIVNIFYLCYPVSVYLILFGFTITPFFDLVNWNAAGSPPMHACTSNAFEVRTEVDNLKTNFNARMKQILFSSILNAYYAGFVPCCFAQNFLYYDVFWSTQHAGFIFLSCFSAYTIQILPLRYCDTLHRATLHLGKWDRVEARSVLPVAYNWQDNLLWPSGTLVRHGKDVFRAQGDTNASEPGNATFARFYTIFKNPTTAMSVLLTLQVVLVIYLLSLLVSKCSAWYQIISVVFLLFFNYYTLFKLGRDYLICLKVYRIEDSLRLKTMH